MKNTYPLIILILSILFISCKDNKNQEYSIKGEIKGDFKDYIYLKENKKMVKVYLQNILYIESLKDYVKVVTNCKTVITKQQLSFLKQT